jgi:chemotaxis protein MotC
MPLLAGLLAILSSGAAPAPTREPGPKPETQQVALPIEPEGALQRRADEPFMAVRAMRSAHDRLVLRSDSSRDELSGVDQKVRNQLLNAPAADWELRRNQVAAVSYALSGGDPLVLRTLMQRGLLKGADQTLISGALAYGEGRLEPAKTALAGLDPTNYPATIAAPLSLIQGVLVAGSDETKAMAALDYARLLAPGTLIEESAFRRQALISLYSEKLERAAYFIGRWLRRFPRSSFAKTFLEQFLTTLSKNATLSPAFIVQTLNANAEHLPAESRAYLLVNIAFHALRNRRFDIAREALPRMERLAPAGSMLELRAKLYEAVADAGTIRAASALRRLRAIEPEQLDDADRALQSAAIGVASQLTGKGFAPAEGAPVASALSASATAALEERARKAIALAVEVAKGVGR